jgi:type VI secretion system VasD/TssJ family lipoprotein
MKNLSLKIYIIFVSISLFGCGPGKETINVNLKCDENTNGGNAVVVTIFQLINSDKFNFSNFNSLTTNPEETLGTDLISNTKFEKTMLPGQSFDLKELEIIKGAAFLGVIADFHSPAKDGSQQLIPLNEEFDQLIIYVHKNSISFKIDD